MKLYEQYKAHLRKTADLKNALAVLQWDQEVYLPSKGAGFRGQQIATLSEQVHALSTDDKLGAILGELVNRQELTEHERKNVALSLEDFEKQKKILPRIRSSHERNNLKVFSQLGRSKKKKFFFNL